MAMKWYKLTFQLYKSKLSLLPRYIFLNFGAMSWLHYESTIEKK